MYSPFEPVLGQSTLPAVFRQQFLFPAHSGQTLHLIGEMQTVWHRPAWVWPFLWALSFSNILFPEQGQAVPASMKVQGGQLGRQPAHHWLRTFQFPNVMRRFNAVMVYDPTLQAVTEKMGPFGLLTMAWHIAFVPPQTIEIVSRRCYLAFGKFKLPLAQPLYPGVRAVETALSSNTIHVRVEVAYFGLGPIFGYEGQFELRNHPHEPAEF